jgi:hypothetical protein
MRVLRFHVRLLNGRVQRLELPVVYVFVVLLHLGAQLVFDPHGVGLATLPVRLDESAQSSETVVGFPNPPSRGNPQVIAFYYTKNAY